MNAFSLYVVGHKPFKLSDDLDDSYKRIAVGLGTEWGGQSGVLCDNTGDNISWKNPNYCELTACYWIWKNDKESECVGICHYRRFFTDDDGVLLTSSKLNDYFSEGYEIILPKPLCWQRETCGMAYLRGAGYKKDLNNCRRIIKERFPEYIDAFDTIMNGNRASYANMLICSKIVFDEYCVWLFDILFELEKVTDMTGYTQQEQRIFGYLSELLINVFVFQRKYRIKYLPVIMVDEIVDSVAQRKVKIKRQIKDVVKHIIWFPSGIKPARRKE